MIASINFASAANSAIKLRGRFFTPRKMS